MPPKKKTAQETVLDALCNSDGANISELMNSNWHQKFSEIKVQTQGNIHKLWLNVSGYTYFKTFLFVSENENKS